MSDLKSQLIQFAAKRIVSEIVHISARNLENKAREEIKNRKVRNAFKPKSIIERKKDMARNDTAGFTEANTRSQAAAAAAQNTDRAKEPVEFWVNTCIVSEDGEEPVRILTGRPLKSFKANREVTTSNEAFNQVNILNNSFVEMLNEDATKLNLGESIYYSPQGTPMTKEGEPKFKKGIYLQLRREETDHTLAAAEKIDLEAAAKQKLRKLFGN